MLKLLGAAIVLIIGIYFSKRLTSEQQKKLITLSSMIDLTDHIRSSIYTSRLPLNDIFSSFKSEHLENNGFIFQLNQNGFTVALESVNQSLTKQAQAQLENLAANLGGINAESQIRLCEETLVSLKEEYSKQKETFSEKKKMYQALPILLATSIIIMTL